MRKLFLFAFLALSISVNGQKPPLDHSVYDSWKSVNQTLISDNGEWIAFTINPQQGDGWLYIYNVSTGRKDSVARGTSPVFSAGCSYIAYQVLPSYSETRQAKKKKLKEDQMPKNSLEIRNLPGNETIRIPRVKSFSVPAAKSLWMAYLLEKSTPGKQPADSINNKKGDLKKPAKKPESKGTELIIFNPLSNKELRFSDVTEYIVAKDGNSISFIQDFPDSSKTDNFKVNIFDSGKEISKVIFEGKGSVKKISTDKSGNYTSFIYSSDTSKIKVYTLYLSRSFNNASGIIDPSDKAMPSGWSVSENGSLVFSQDGTRLYFGTAPKPVKEPEDTLLDEEKYKLDIWSWDDNQLQPMQKKQLDQELKRTYQAVYHTDRNIMYQLADTSMPSVRLNPKSESNLFLGTANLKYQKLSSWETRNYTDYYLVNSETGTKSLVLEKYPSYVMLSPSGKYIISWDPEMKQYIVMSANKVIHKMITAPNNYPLYDELNDTPEDPSPYGIAGWTNDENQVLIYDKYDIWSFSIDGKEDPVNITNGFGRSNNLRFRYVKLNPDAEFISTKDLIYLSAFNLNSKEAGFFSVKPYKNENPVKLIFEKASFPDTLTKAKYGNKIIWQKESFDISPELYVSDLNFANAKKLSVTNPQQAKYNWITAEFVEWTSFDNQELQGILYKPEDFDPAKKYPMIVYFYERSSDGIYRYYPPAPSRSIINRSFAVSNGYLLFVPDIPYKTGYPGESCYNAVVSGTYSLLNKFNYIDKEKLGLDGQSWGGYQIAWLVTRTDLFRCAYAGAPVSNMISAYGGIRWESGMSRMFQYEHSQSRIGGTLWEKPLHFIENSPIFFVPKINTPLLLMHNDADGAVPWYQGIEFITALRRLEKPAWLLSYNDEAHNLVKRPNKKDLSIRKMQFFDHYLKGAEMPYWMKNGITQTEKGKKDGYNLVTDN
jgi:dipeptidyl aminopeptidase/acylaminoacyl peptidase